MQNYCDSLSRDLGSGGASSQSATDSTAILGSRSDSKRTRSTRGSRGKNDDAQEKRPKRRRISLPDQNNVDSQSPPSQSPPAPLLLPPKQTEKEAERQRVKEEKEAERQRVKEEKEAVRQRVKEEKEAERQRVKEEKEAVRQRVKEEKEAVRQRVKEEKEAVRQRVKEEKEAVRQRVKEEKEAVRQRVKEEKEAKRKADLEEWQRLIAEKEAKRKADLEEWQRLIAEKEARKKAKLEEKQRLEAVKEAKRKAKLEKQQHLIAEKEAEGKAKLEKQQRLIAEKEARKKAKLDTTEWHHNHQEIIRGLQQRLKAEKEGDESTRKKLKKQLELQEELLQKFDDETDERKRSNLQAGIDYSGRLLVERIDESTDEQTKKKLDGYLKTEYTQLLGTAIHQNNYLLNLGRRKKIRGHSGSEEYLKQLQKLQEAKKAFGTDVKAKQHKDIDEEFSELKEVIKATADGRSDDLHGNAGEFSEEDAAAMAGEKVEEMLTLLAKDAKISVDDILPPCMTLEEFLKIDRKDKDAMNRLRGLAMKEAEKKGEPLLDAEAIGQEDIKRFGELSFLTCLQILIYHDDIVDSVVKKKVGVIRHPTSRKWLFFAHIPNELIAHFCIGSIVIEGLDLEDFERKIRIKGKYVIQLFGGEEYIRLYRVTETSIERVKFCVKTTDNLFTFVCNTQRDKSYESEKKYAGAKHWSLHRLEQVVLFNLDLGMNKREWFRDYFGLKGIETFEEKLNYYKYDPDAAKKRRARLELKGWENVSQAVQCDVDHLIGRMHMWMNASIFGMPCSHSWNQCMGKVRQRMGCWGFAFATIEYNGGN